MKIEIKNFKVEKVQSQEIFQVGKSLSLESWL